MMELGMFNICILLVLGFVILYAILDRICKCIEHGKTAKAFNNIIDKFDNESMNAIKKIADDIEASKHIL